MSISSITSGTMMPQDFQNIRQQQRQDFSQLAQALQDGDLTGAQKAYSDLQSLLPSNNQSGTNTNTNSGSPQNPIQSDFAALGKALSSGDLSQAQSEFSQLQTDLKNAYQNQSGIPGLGVHRGGHHHHHEAPSDTNKTTVNSTSGTSGTQSNGTTTGGLNVVA